MPTCPSITGPSSLDGYLLPPHFEFSIPFLVDDSLNDSHGAGALLRATPDGSPGRVRQQSRGRSSSRRPLSGSTIDQLSVTC